MILRLITISEYCKKEKITDAAVRKKIKNNQIKSCIFDNQTYVIIDDDVVDKQQTKIKLLNSKIKQLQSELKQYTKQDDLINELKQKIEKLETKLEKNQAKKDELYEKVITHLTSLKQISN